MVFHIVVPNEIVTMFILSEMVNGLFFTVQRRLKYLTFEALCYVIYFDSGSKGC